MGSERGLLIVNADDWGYDEETTKAIADCHTAGGVTSTTAMMFMRGSKPAASLARENPRLGIGLHLNLIEEYSDLSTPEEIRARQRRLVGYFRKQRLRRWLYDPLVRRDVNSIIADQLRCFVDLYGRPPTHIDGHHHCHQSANVVLSGAVPPGTKIRNALSDTHRAKGIMGTLRLARRKLVSRRLPSTDYFFSIATVWPTLEGPPPMEELALARRASVEVMVHPSFPSERSPLQSAEWVDTLRDFQTGTFDDLQV
jgi:predicted glycoside hydrolase/deacetylase ChbG (UPF0249 family)